jgi:hypothetical protein
MYTSCFKRRSFTKQGGRFSLDATTTDLQFQSMAQTHEMSVIESHDDPDDQHDHVSIAQEPTTATSLPAADGGIAAWRLLITAFVFEALLWGGSASHDLITPILPNALLKGKKPGFPLCFGVFQAHYSTLPEFKDSPYIAVVGTIASGMSYLAAPLIIPFVKRYSRYRYLMIWIGCKLVSTTSSCSLPTHSPPPTH